MEEAPVTAATGTLGPVIAKLTALLGSEYKLRWRTRRDVKFIRSKLKPVHSILWDIWEKEELDAVSRAFKMEALDLADDVDEAMVDFILSLEHSLSNKKLVQIKIKTSPFRDFKERASDVSGRCCRRWKEKEKPAAVDSSPGKPRVYPFVRKDASELLGMVGPRDKLIRYLVGEDKGPGLQLKTVSIFGMAGMGKTTLADQVFEAIGNKFESRAFVSVTPGGNIRDVLVRILEQVVTASSEYKVLPGTETSTEEHHIDIISNFLKDKRYLVIIDDIRNWREWKVITKSLPENNLGSRVVGVTRIIDVAQKCLENSYRPNVLLHKMLPDRNHYEGLVYKIDNENIVTRMVATKPDLVAEGFDDEHPIVRMCGGTPLAVCCMLSAVTEEREKQAHQGLYAKACDVQDKIEKHLMENGIQNTPGFEPLVESLQLGFDDLPRHMLKTCLLYCSIYPDGYIFKSHHLVRRWISEGLVCKEEEANSFIEELIARGLILGASEDGHLRMHPMMQNFLRCKSRQDNFSTCSSEITYNNTSRIRRLCIHSSPCRSGEETVDPLSVLNWYHIRSLVVCEGIERVPLEKLECLRVLDLCRITGVLDRHLKDICGLVRLRHLLDLNGDGMCETPPEIVMLQCLETFEASGKEFTRLHGFIGKLQQLKTLEVSGEAITELPREIGALQQLQTLRMRNTCITELPREVWSLQQLKTLDMSRTEIMELPKEIGKLQQLRTLDMSNTEIRELPKEIWKLHQLRTLDMRNTEVTELPKEIGELRHLEYLLMTGTRVAEIPKEIWTLEELKSIKLDINSAALTLTVSALVELPERIRQALNKINLMSSLAGEMLSYQISDELFVGYGGLVVGAKQMHIPLWIREHFNDLAMLDIRICKLEEQGLKILREMPYLRELTLRFEVVPREPVVISNQGFEMLEVLRIDSRVPRISFQEAAMPRLQWLIFEFRFYEGRLNTDPVGINHLRSLQWIQFRCNEDWYAGGESPCIRPTIDVMRNEGQELPNLRYFDVCGRNEQMGQPREMEEEEEEEEERSSGVGEIEEVTQA